MDDEQCRKLCVELIRAQCKDYAMQEKEKQKDWYKRLEARKKAGLPYDDLSDELRERAGRLAAMNVYLMAAERYPRPLTKEIVMAEMMAANDEIIREVRKRFAEVLPPPTPVGQAGQMEEKNDKP